MGVVRLGEHLYSPISLYAPIYSDTPICSDAPHMSECPHTSVFPDALLYICMFLGGICILLYGDGAIYTSHIDCLDAITRIIYKKH